jgi:hypothetical protein
MSRFRAVNARDVKIVKGKPDQEKVETSEKDVKRKICQGERGVQTTVAPRKGCLIGKMVGKQGREWCDFFPSTDPFDQT